MKITITITNCVKDKTFNIQVDNKQKIETTIRVLRENLPEMMQGLGGRVYIKSKRSKRRITLSENYEHELIFNGDTLLLNNELPYDKE